MMITHEVTMNIKATLVHNFLKLKAELVAQHSGMEPNVRTKVIIIYIHVKQWYHYHHLFW